MLLLGDSDLAPWVCTSFFRPRQITVWSPISLAIPYADINAVIMTDHELDNYNLAAALEHQLGLGPPYFYRRDEDGNIV